MEIAKERGVEQSAEFSERLNLLLDKAGVPDYGRKAYLARTLNVSKRTPALWFNGSLPREQKLYELADHLKGLVNIERPLNEVVAWLTTGVPAVFELPAQRGERKQTSEDHLDFRTKAKIYRAIHLESKKVDINIYELESNVVDKLLGSLIQLVYENIDERGDAYLDDVNSEFHSILHAQLLLISKKIY